MSNVWMAAFIILTLSCLTGLLETIPLCVLGAVIESAIMSLLDFAEMRRVRGGGGVCPRYARSPAPARSHRDSLTLLLRPFHLTQALRVAPLSALVMILTFLATFLLTIETGLLIG